LEKIASLFCGIDPLFHLAPRIKWIHIKERAGRIMGVKERIMAIRLIEKLQEHLVYAKALGIEVCVGRTFETIDNKEK
jgi:hypothetical protein